jgi:hypothetical protein
MPGNVEWEVGLDKVEGGNEYGSLPTGGAPSDGQEADPAQQALIRRWSERLRKEKAFHEPAFKRMDYCMQIAAEGADKAWVEENLYTVPVANRHINTVVSALYAKNPTVVAKRKKKLLYQIWDGDPTSLEQALHAAQPPVDPMTGAPMIDPMTGMPAQGDPQAIALLEEVAAAQEYMRMIDRMGKTLEILVDETLHDEAACYKEELKAVVRRTKTVGVGYIRLQFQRVMQPSPMSDEMAPDLTTRTAAMQADAKEVADGDASPDSATAAELQNMQSELQEPKDVIVSEGAVLAFPGPKQVIIDRNCKHLKTLRGANFVAYEYDKTPKEIYEDYQVDVGTAFTTYQPDGAGAVTAAPGKEATPDTQGCAKLWEVWDKRTQQVFTICDGYPNYLKPPAAPDVKLKRFYDLFCVVFNEVENDKQLYPPSDVWLIRHPQQDYNRSRQGLREHRQANRPKYVTPKGRLEDTDLQKLSSHPSSAILALKGLAPGDDVGKLIQRMPMVGIDPNQYMVEDALSDIMRTVGSQEANLGGTSKGTATEAAIGEQSRGSTIADNVDDLDDALTQLARALGELFLMEMHKEQVIEIVGPGAVWPELPPTREQVVKSLYLDIRAGSTGRPNQAQEMAVLQQLTPLIIQVPGVKPANIARKAADILGEDFDDFYVEGLPSISAMNAAASKPPALPTGDPATDPNMQGGQGGQNAPTGPDVQNGPGVPAFPAAQAPIGGQPLVQA